MRSRKRAMARADGAGVARARCESRRVFSIDYLSTNDFFANPLLRSDVARFAGKNKGPYRPHVACLLRSFVRRRPRLRETRATEREMKTRPATHVQGWYAVFVIMWARAGNPLLACVRGSHWAIRSTMTGWDQTECSILVAARAGVHEP